ncbi:hypothetical protein VNO77_33301 [Canavalia gladiata]|uniref:GRAM domain-containing protein n=1 Tax=Canavalia gladiata TaxID=3824 RepID=A0AAN9KEG9_CANGL
MKVNGCLSRRSFYFPKLQDNLPLQSSGSNGSDLPPPKQTKKMKSRTQRKISSLASRIHEHGNSKLTIQMGPKLSETLKGKLSLGTRIIQGGGRGNIFKNIFGMKEKEQLLKASQCYYIPQLVLLLEYSLSQLKRLHFTVKGPQHSLLQLESYIGAPYKVLIPIEKIKKVYESQNVNKLEEKYIEIVTEDESEFWFVGFLRYEKALRNLKKAIAMPINSEREKLLLTS